MADNFPLHDPDHTLDYSLDISALVGKDATHPVVECQTKNASDITITDVQIAQGVVSCHVSGGKAGQTYMLYFGAKFSDGIRNHGKSRPLKCKEG